MDPKQNYAGHRNDGEISRNMSANSSGNYSMADLEEASRKMAIELLPAMVVFGLFIIMGLVGNLLVCYVFGFRLKPNTQHFFILCLAVTDLFNVLIGMPVEITDMAMNYTFEYELACKLMRSLTTLSAVISIHTLVAIAVDRFRKLCRPYSTQLTLRHAKFLVFFIVVLSLALSWPAYFINGIRPVDAGIPGIPGRDCSTADNMKDSVIPLAYYIVFFLIFATFATCLIVMYYHIFRGIRKHDENMRQNRVNDVPRFITADPKPQIPLCVMNYDHQALRAYDSMDETDNNVFEDPKCRVKNIVASCKIANEFSSSSVQSVSEENDNSNAIEESQDSDIKVFAMKELDKESELSNNMSNQNDVASKESGKKHENTCMKSVFKVPRKRNGSRVRLECEPSVSTSQDANEEFGSQLTVKMERPFTSHLELAKSVTSISSAGTTRSRTSSKTSMIFFLVTLVFFLSFLPHLCLRVVKFIHEDYDKNLTGAPLVLKNIFRRSYFINSVSNPFIYGALNMQFKKEVKDLVKRLCGRA